MCKVKVLMLLAAIAAVACLLILSQNGSPITESQARDCANAKLSQYCSRNKLSYSQFPMPKVIRQTHLNSNLCPGWLFKYVKDTKPKVELDIYVDENGGTDIISASLK